jgi:hypothetical protein
MVLDFSSALLRLGYFQFYGTAKVIFGAIDVGAPISKNARSKSVTCSDLNDLKLKIGFVKKMF